MNFIKTQLENAYKQKKLICICTKKIDWNSRIIGYIKNIDAPAKFEIEIIDEFGQVRNSKVLSFASIKSLEIGGTYNANLEKLNNKGFKKNEHSSTKYFSSKKMNLYKKLTELKETKSLSTFFFDTEFSIGIVEDISQDEFLISNVAYDGSDDGISVFDIRLLTKIRCESNLERRISFLRK